MKFDQICVCFWHFMIWRFVPHMMWCHCCQCHFNYVSLIFVASVSEDANGSGFLKQLLFTVQEAIEKLPGWPDVSPLLIVDDLSILTSLGCKEYDVTLFFQDLRTMLCPHGGSIICLIHTYDNDIQDLSRDGSLYSLILHQSDMMISVQPLKTGYCRDLSGEVLILIWLHITDFADTF